MSRTGQAPGCAGRVAGAAEGGARWLRAGCASLAHQPMRLAAWLLDEGGAGLREYEARLLPPPPRQTGAAPARVEAAWLGVAGIWLTDGETSLLIDPCVTRPPLWQVVTGWPVLPRATLAQQTLARLGQRSCAAVLVSHSHYDHALDAPTFATLLDAPLVGSESTLNIGRGAALPEGRLVAVAAGRPLCFGAFEVTFRESAHSAAFGGRVPFPGEISHPLHPPAPASAYRLGGTFAIHVRHPAGSLVHHGSAAVLPTTFANMQADVVLLGLAGRGNTARYLREAVAALGAPRVIPIHCDDFFAPLGDRLEPLVNVRLPEFFRAARRHRPPLDVRTLPLLCPRVVLPRD